MQPTKEVLALIEEKKRALFEVCKQHDITVCCATSFEKDGNMLVSPFYNGDGNMILNTMAAMTQKFLDIAGTNVAAMQPMAQA